MFKYATAHTAVIGIAALRRLFPQRVISHFGDVPWPPRSPYLTAPDLFLRGYLKKVYSTRPTDLHALKENIREEIAKLSEKHFKPLCAPVHRGGWWPPKRHCTQKVKLCKKKLSTIVNCDVLKLVSITFRKILFLFIISSLFLPHPVAQRYDFDMSRMICENENISQSDQLITMSS